MAKNKIRGGFPVKNVLIALAIALISVFFVAYATQSFYPSPDYERYCNYSNQVDYLTKSSCEENGGQWNPYIGEKPIGENRTGYCYANYQCEKDYREDSEAYERNVFFVNMILGLLIVVLSFILTFETVSNGFMSGGVLLLFYGSVRYWGNLSNSLRTIMLGIVLVVLVWVAYKKLK